MTRYLISFDAHAMDHIPAEDMPAVTDQEGPRDHARPDRRQLTTLAWTRRGLRAVRAR